jgi:hypothetical protein
MGCNKFAPGRVIQLFVSTLALSAMVACAPATVRPVESYQGSGLPRPETVVVENFAATPDDVKLDAGLGARLRNSVNGKSATARQTEDIRNVAQAISTTLVAEIQKLGLPAVSSSETGSTHGPNTLIVGGRITSIDEGNRTRRNVIGLGAGRSDVKAYTGVYYTGSGGGTRQLLESFEADAASGRKPGAAETLGAGAAAGRVAESAAATAGTSMAPALSADIAADGQRLAKAIAKQLAGLFVKQGWIPAKAER